jgi:DNA invertase Pin-like site-specific DNA recombinase
MLIGYARTSTLDQVAGFEAQKRELQAFGCEEIYCEQVSSVAARSELDAALAFVRKGDCLVVTKLDRLARSMPHFFAITETLKNKGADLVIIGAGIDTRKANDPTSKALMGMLSVFASFEREMMLERQRDGIAAAKAAGRYKGRVPTARTKAEDVLARRDAGEGAASIAKALKISPASVYRIIADAAATQTA